MQLFAADGFDIGASTIGARHYCAMKDPLPFCWRSCSDTLAKRQNDGVLLCGSLQHHCNPEKITYTQKLRGMERDKRVGTNRAKFADFRCFLEIFALTRNYSISDVQIFAGNRRFSQKFAGNCIRIAETHLSLVVCPL